MKVRLRGKRGMLRRQYRRLEWTTFQWRGCLKTLYWRYEMTRCENDARSDYGWRRYGDYPLYTQPRTEVSWVSGKILRLPVAVDT